jgi:hypothetical protein
MLVPALIGVLLPAAAAGHITNAIRAEPGTAGAASPAVVAITVSTPMAGGAVVRGLGHLELTGKAGEFWTPFDLGPWKSRFHRSGERPNNEMQLAAPAQAMERRS